MARYLYCIDYATCSAAQYQRAVDVFGTDSMITHCASLLVASLSRTRVLSLLFEKKACMSYSALQCQRKWPLLTAKLGYC